MTLKTPTILLQHAFFVSIPYEWYTNNDIAKFEGYYASVFYSYFGGGRCVTVGARHASPVLIQEIGKCSVYEPGQVYMN